MSKYIQIKKEGRKKKQFNEKYPEFALIFKVLLNEGISLDKFIEELNLIFERYNNQNNKNQKLDDLDKSLTASKSRRSKRVNFVMENLQNIQQIYYKEKKLIEFQIILQYAFELIAKELRTAIIYNNQYLSSYEILQTQSMIKYQRLNDLIEDK